MDIMKQGQIACSCGNVYYFQSIRSEVICMKCGKMNENNGKIVEETPEDKQTEQENE